MHIPPLPPPPSHFFRLLSIQPLNGFKAFFQADYHKDLIEIKKKNLKNIIIGTKIL